MKYKQIPPFPDSVEEPVEVGAFQAKTELSRLLRAVKTGRRFVITQRGKPVAELGPVSFPRTAGGGRGDLAGKIRMAEDFSEEIEDMREYME